MNTIRSMSIASPVVETVAESRQARRAREEFISIRALHKVFGNQPVLKEVDINIRQGEIFCLLGSSGCGKTTLLRILAGFESPSSGSVMIDNMEMGALPPYRRPVSMMFQSYALFPHLTVEQNVAFGLKQKKIPRHEIRQRVAAILAMVHLDGFEKRRPDRLSGGQRQRVALARCLVTRPKVLLLDEPLGALDRRLRQETQSELLRIQRELGTTFVVVTHDQEEAMTLSTRIGIMNQGHLVQVGTPKEIYESPNCRYVASFIGEVNFFPGVLACRGGKEWVLDAGGLGDIPLAGDAATLTVGRPGCVAVRPEKVHMSALRGVVATLAPGRLIALPGRISELSYRGDCSLYTVTLDGGTVVTVKLQNHARETADSFALDESVMLGWALNDGMMINE